MASIAPGGTRFTSEEYFALIDQGTLRPDDRVELLEGVVVAMAPQNPRHAVAGDLVCRLLLEKKKGVRHERVQDEDEHGQGDEVRDGTALEGVGAVRGCEDGTGGSGRVRG